MAMVFVIAISIFLISALLIRRKKGCTPSDSTPLDQTVYEKTTNATPTSRSHFNEGTLGNISPQNFSLAVSPTRSGLTTLTDKSEGENVDNVNQSEGENVTNPFYIPSSHQNLLESEYENISDLRQKYMSEGGSDVLPSAEPDHIFQVSNLSTEMQKNPCHTVSTTRMPQEEEKTIH